MHPEPGVRYRINDRDEIMFVDAGWDEFASSNDGQAMVADRILGQSLWDFITDSATRELYRKMIARVRQGHQVQFKLRCDGPDCRRELEMTIQAAESNSIEFSTQNLRVEERPPIPLLALDTPRSNELLRVCAWCNRVHVGADEWTEVEEAVARLNLFEKRLMPQLTHGICEECFDKMNNDGENRDDSDSE